MRKLLWELLGVTIAMIELTALIAIRRRVIRIGRSVTIAEVYAEQIRQRSQRDASN